MNRYFVTEYQPTVQYGAPRVFATKGEAMKYARSERDAAMRRAYRKVQTGRMSGTRIAQFCAVHPTFGVQYAATVHDSALREVTP